MYFIRLINIKTPVPSALPCPIFCPLRFNILRNAKYYYYSQTSLIRTPKGQNQLSALQRCPYYRGRECMILGISGTKRTVRRRKVSVRRD